MCIRNQRNVDEIGRIVLPKDMRNHYGIKAGDELMIVATKEGILIKAPAEKEN